MSTVTVTFSKSGFGNLASIDSAQLTFNNGTAQSDVEDNVEHSLRWFASGAEGDSYTIAITDPPSAQFSHSATFDSGGKDAGIHWFTAIS